MDLELEDIIPVYLFLTAVVKGVFIFNRFNPFSTIS